MATGLLGLYQGLEAVGMLSLANEGNLSTPDSYQMAVWHALWRSAQEHRSAVIGHAVATLVLAVTLLLASMRVFLRERGAGWLWRQALLGNVVLSFAAMAIERSLLGGRAAALRSVLTAAGAAIQLPPGYSPELTFRVWMWLNVVIAGLLFVTWVLSTREEARAALD